MKSLFLAVVMMVIGAEVHAESKSHSDEIKTKMVRDYK